MISSAWFGLFETLRGDRFGVPTSSFVLPEVRFDLYFSYIPYKILRNSECLGIYVACLTLGLDLIYFDLYVMI